MNDDIMTKGIGIGGRSYRVVFLTGPPLKMSLDWPPPKFAWTGPPLISLSVGIMLRSHSLRQTLRRFPIRGGASLGLYRFF